MARLLPLLLALVMLFSSAFAVSSDVTRTHEILSSYTMANVAEEPSWFVRFLSSHTGLPIQGKDCLANIGDVVSELTTFATHFEGEKYEKALSALANTLRDLSGTLAPCDTQNELTKLLSVAADHIEHGTVSANAIVVDGKEIRAILEGLSNAIKDKRWSVVGSYVARLSGYLMPLVHCEEGNEEVCRFVSGMLHTFEVVGTHVKPCMHDLGAAYNDFIAAYSAIEDKDAVNSLKKISQGLDATAAGLNSCGFADIAGVFSEHVAEVVRADISFVSGDVKIIAGGVDIGANIIDFINALKSGDYARAGVAIGNVAVDLSRVNCTGEACGLVDSLFTGLSIFFKDFKQCRSEVEHTIADFEDIIKYAKQNDMGHMVTATSDALAAVGSAIDRCGLTAIARVVDAEAKKLGAAEVHIGDVLQVIVNDVNVASDLIAAVHDLVDHNWADAGRHLANLVNALRRSGCKTDSCLFLEDFLVTARVFVPDLDACAEDITDALKNFKAAGADIRRGSFGTGLHEFSSGMHEIHDALNKCHVDQLSHFVGDLADKVKDGSGSSLGGIVQIITNGINIADDVLGAVDAAEDHDVTSLGRYLGSLVKDMKHAGCDSTVCKFAEGILQTVSDAIASFKPCERQLSTAWHDIEAVASDVGKGNSADALKHLVNAAEALGDAFGVCKIDKVAQDIGALSALLGLGKVNVAELLVSGVDIWADLESFRIHIEDGNHQAAGKDIGKIISIIIKLNKDKCSGAAWCLVGNGIIQALDIIPDWKLCGHDVELTWDDLVSFYNDASRTRWGQAKDDMAHFLDDFDAAIRDCKLIQIAELIGKVAAEIAGSEVSWISKIVHIVVNGLDIVHGLKEIVEGWNQGNWMEVGIGIGSLVKLVVLDTADAPILQEQFRVAVESAAATGDSKALLLMDSINSGKFQYI